MIHCPRCGGVRVVKNGPTHNGKQAHRCRDCGRAFVLGPEKRLVTEAQKELVRRLLGERVARRATHRATGIARSWLQSSANELYAATPPRPRPAKKSRGG